MAAATDRASLWIYGLRWLQEGDSMVAQRGGTRYVVEVLEAGSGARCRIQTRYRLSAIFPGGEEEVLATGLLDEVLRAAGSEAGGKGAP